MKYITILTLSLASCSISPGWATDTEMAQNAHDDQTFAAQEDAKLVTALRAEGVEVAAYSPGVPVENPPPVTVEEAGWSDTIVAVATALGAVAASLGGVRLWRGPATPQANKETVAEATSAGKKA